MNDSKKYTVLFVDDERRITNALRALFRRSYEVHTANSAQEAFEIMRELTIDVLVSDQRMPEMEGSELLSIVSKIYPQTVRIMLTGFMDRDAIVDSINNGEVYRFIDKPWDVDDISQIIADAALASTLPVENPLREGSDAEIEEALAHAIQEKAILVLEKNKEVRNLIRKYCQDREAMNYSTQNIEQLISAVETRPSIGVLIIELAKEASVETIQTINLLKQVRPELVVITITQEYDAQIAVELINQGQVFKYLARPVDTQNLSEAIDQAFHRNIFLKDNEEFQQRYNVKENNSRIDSGLQGLFKRFLSKAN